MRQLSPENRQAGLCTREEMRGVGTLLNAKRDAVNADGGGALLLLLHDHLCFDRWSDSYGTRGVGEC